MHMSDALISTAVGTTLWAVSSGLGYTSSKKIQETIESHRLPLMGVMGAFVFSAQMINFTIPGTGSSGHIGGGILLAALLGPQAGFLTLAAVLLIQALFFGDGGLLAYGCNVFNLGFFTCFVAYPLIFKPMIQRQLNRTRLMIAAILAVVVALQLGSLGVVLQTTLSGKTELPFGAFIALMQPIHLAIGLVEGAITAAILTFLWQARPELIYGMSQNSDLNQKTVKTVGMILVVATLVIGGGLSLLASSNPDGLEWSVMGVSGAAELESEPNAITSALSRIQEMTAFMPDYAFKQADGPQAILGTSVAGLVGSGITLLVLLGLGVSQWVKSRRLKVGSYDRKNR